MGTLRRQGRGARQTPRALLGIIVIAIVGGTRCGGRIEETRSTKDNIADANGAVDAAMRVVDGGTPEENTAVVPSSDPVGRFPMVIDAGQSSTVTRDVDSAVTRDADSVVTRDAGSAETGTDTTTAVQCSWYGTPTDGDTGAIVPPANPYGGPGSPLCYTQGFENQSAPCEYGLYCLHSCYTDADCPVAASGGAEPVCQGWTIGDCKLRCDDEHACPQGMYCAPDYDIGHSCVWHHALGAWGCCGEVGYGCDDAAGDTCCDGLVCKGHYCVPPEWSPPALPASLPPACGVDQDVYCDPTPEMGVTIVNYFSGMCTYRLPDNSLTPQQIDSNTNVILGIAYDTDLSAEYARTIPRVDGPDQCTENGGWFFVDIGGTRHVRLCPSSCECATCYSVNVGVEVGCGEVAASSLSP